MAETILIATVGGSCTPVVCAVRGYAPDYAVFICSGGPRGSGKLVDGAGDVCGEGGPRGRSIVAQTSLAAEQYAKVEIADVDDVGACVDAVMQAYARAFARGDAATVIADYTGGTKTMTAALVRVATGRYALRSRLSVVTGQRDNLRAVQDGTEMTTVHDSAMFALEEQWHVALRLFNGYHYASADALLAEITRHPTSPALRRKTALLVALCRGFDAWDRFDHARALELLRPQGTLIGPFLSDINTLAKAGQGLEAWGPPCMLPVYDLLLNAERRAAQGRHDDAVARLYRALELLAQNRLWGAHGIKTGNVDRAKVPAWWLAAREGAKEQAGEAADIAATPQGQKEGGAPLRIGLRDGYRLLAALDDPVGRAFHEYETRLLTMLERRNQSILAHGTQPITATEYGVMQQPVADLVAGVIRETGLKMRPLAQFPAFEAEQLAP